MEYIWIAGPSSVGKTTFLETILRPESADQRRRFGITGSNIRVFGVGSNSEVAADDIATVQADHVLIHWRYRIHDRMTELCDQRPDCGHRAIVLWRPLRALQRDLERCSQHKNRSLSRVWQEWQIVKNQFRQIDRRRVAIEVVDASHASYPALDPWP